MEIRCVFFGIGTEFLANFVFLELPLVCLFQLTVAKCLPDGTWVQNSTRLH